MGAQRFEVIARSAGRGRVLVEVPFDPDQTWGPKRLHRITGTVNGMGVRGVIEVHGEYRAFLVGSAWLRGCGIGTGDALTVIIEPEGPQRDDLADDVAAALESNPYAGEFFDSLAQFYRHGYLQWIDATKRRPDLRAQRIAEMIRLLTAGVKQRPRQ